MTTASIRLVKRSDAISRTLNSSLKFLNDHRVLIRFAILTLIALFGFAQRLFSIVRYESIIHEFDPWFNYRATMYLVKNGWYEFINWFDETAWYPLGRNVGGTVYPGIMATSASIHFILNKIIAFPVNIRDICVFLAPAFSGLTAYATYLLTRELKDPSAGLFAAAFMVMCPGYISRSVAGSFDNEAISIFQMMACFYLWIKALKSGSALVAAACAMCYFYMVSSWGGYAFVANLIPLHAFSLLCMGRFSSKLYTSYSTYYVLGTLASMTVPFVGFAPTRTSEHMAALGTFGLMQLVAIAQTVRGLVPNSQFQFLLKAAVAAFSALGLGSIVALSLTGKISPWGGRFYSLWDTGYAAKHIPIIASVSEHQPTAWSSMFMDFQWLFYLFPAGIYWCLRQRRDEHIFAILFAITACYFAGVMVRLVLTLAPIVCVAAGISCSALLDSILRTEKENNAKDANRFSSAESNIDSSIDSSDYKSSGKKASKNPGKKQVGFDFITKLLVIAPLAYHAVTYVYHAVWITQMAYSSPSVVISSRNPQTGQEMIVDDFREAYYWIRRNTAKDARILSWWDYGYQIAGLADRTTIVDNNTWNNTHIATVGKVMATSEPVAYKTMRLLDANYVLVVCGALTGYAGDDVNKFLWMVRIAGGVYPKDVKESDYMSANGNLAVDSSASTKFRESILYKTVYHRMSELGGPNVMDGARRSPIGDPNAKLSVLEEVFSSERMMVRIYKVKSPDAIGRPLRQATNFA